ncbi:hypothetical protein ACE193_21395 [Bernardetia sp. OM2101]|uniref:hypothetical protein n=1 Tax=Bernardetia sp. OM2101 TaxID=3344876 RepID=UPI0035D07634
MKKVILISSKAELLKKHLQESLFNDQQLIALKDILSRLYNVSLIGLYSDGTPIYKNEEQIQHIKSEIESRTKTIIESQNKE